VEKDDLSRRRFLELAGAIAATSALGSKLWAQESRGGIAYKSFGRTGEKVSIIGIGGAHLGKPEEDVAVRIVRTALDSGINFMDNCWDYNNGASELRMGKALRDGYRQKAFLMTKVDGRDKKTAAQQIDESLKRLGTDHVDLLQFHEVIRRDDPERIFAPGGAFEAFADAQQAGKIRFIGFTGHKSPEIHLHMLKTAADHGFRFDAVLMPVNVMDAHYDSFAMKVMPQLVEAQIGIQTMKPIGGGEILASHTASAPECLRFALTHPTSVVITGCDSMDILEQALSVARNFKPMQEHEIAELLQKTAGAARAGRFELYKTSTHFDGTVQHPEWLGQA
jgi:predicted aldo/keto reductase-like oxidoreductase